MFIPIPGPIRKILAILRGGVSPVLILISITLGFWFGLIPGWSGFHTAIIILMFILNIHVGMFLLSAAIAKALCYAAAPVFFHVGVVLQEHLGGLYSLLSSIPIIGMTDFGTYSVAAGVVLGPIIGIIIGLLMARSVTSFRKMMLKHEDGSEKFKKWYSNRWGRILDRILIGKRTKDAKALFTGKTKVIRKAGVTFAVIVLVVSIGAAAMLKDTKVKDYATASMTKANGAEVNLEDLDLSVLTGSFAASGIQVTDAQQPTKNQVAIETIAADASVYNLLLGKLVMENVEVSDVQFGQDRAAPGRVLDTKERPPVFDPCDFKVSVSDIGKLEQYLKNAKQFKEWLQKVSKWLPKSEDEQIPAAEEAPRKYLEYLQARAIVPPSPRMLAKKVTLDKVQIPSKLFGNSRMLLTNVSDAPRSAGLPITIDVNSYDTPAALKITFDFESGQPQIKGTFAGLDLSKLQSSISRDAGLMFQQGTASGGFNGQITSRNIDLSINLNISDMKAGAQGDGVLGLGSNTTSEALKVLQNLSTTIRVVGPIAEPRLAFDVKGLTDSFKDALIKAGKERLAGEIDKRLTEQLDKKLGDKVPDEIKDVLKKPKGLIDGLGGLLGGKDDKKDDKKD